MIYMISDHAGYNLKQSIIQFLFSINLDVKDLGTYSSESVDYPDYAFKLGEAITTSKCNDVWGIAICGTGIGMSIALNKVKNIQAALIHNDFTALHAKTHNNANVICIGARLNTYSETVKMINTFMHAKFELGTNHERRIEKIKKYEGEHYGKCS